MRILSLMTQCGENDYPHAPEKLQELFKRQFSWIGHKFIILDTGSEKSGIIQKRGKLDVLGVSNQYREFSGFDEGVKFLAEELDNYDLINLATAAFDQPPNEYLRYFIKPVAKFVIENNCVVGNIDAYNDKIRLYADYSRHWLRTSFILLKPSALKKLPSLAPVKKDNVFFGNSWESPFKENCPVCQNYKEILLEWLTGKKFGKLEEIWHSSFDLNEETFQKFKKKSISIFNEHAFSINLRKNGLRLADVTWLHNNLKRIKKDGVIPDWEDQVRDRFPVMNRPSLHKIILNKIRGLLQ